MQYYNNGMNNSAMIPSYTNGWAPNQMPNNSFGTSQMQPQQNTPVIDWVMGRSGAEAYMLKPNTNAFLMDSNTNGDIVYTKSTDMSGRYSPLQSYKMVPFEEQPSGTLPEPIDYDKIRSIISEEVIRQMGSNNISHNSNNKKEAR